MKLKIDKKRKIFIVLSIISICIIVVIGIFYPLIVHTIIPNGTKESTVRYILGIPYQEHNGSSGYHIFDYFPPNLPPGIMYRSLIYSFQDQWLSIVFISPSDYSNVTHSSITTSEWLVIYKDSEPKGFVH